MQTTLLNFTNQDLFDASRAFFAKIGVKCTDQSRLPLNFLSVYEKSVKKLGLAVPQALADVFAKIETTHVIGAVTEDSLHGNTSETSLEQIEAAEQHYKGMLLMAVKVKDGIALTRTEMTQVTRGANRIATHNPVTVLILQAGKLSIATCERTQFVQSWRPGEKLGKVSILKDINCSHPHRGHLDILLSLDVSSCKTYDDLYAHWKDVFSAKLLTKQFYREIQNWYFWALKADQHVSFPNALDDDTDDEKFNKENLIRLITRLVFTWFMKAKGLVNEDLFKPDFLASALKHFDPEGAMDDPSAKDADKRCTYYRAILQNLFFATFNQAIADRGFVDTQVLDAKRYNIKNYFRNAQLFTETDKAKIIAYFDDSPMVNGGLFECLDNVEQFDKETGKTRVYSWDGFSNNVHFKDGSLKSALIPDRLFFGAEQVVDLSEFLEKDKTSKAVKVRGIVNILNDYVFTIEENTPLDEDVALDPELLGKVFENLLGCYNPETQQMARNATGSFYTPREIVNYMVRVSLAAYLKRTCPKIVPAEINALVEGRVELESMPSVKEGAQEILMALFKAKILDPACGSGAFPMGTLAAIVEILRTLDPDNKHWFKIVLEESLKEAESVADVGDEKERAELKAQIEYDFQKRVDFPDYARKLYVIEHCIFGSDIQPIAVQISRLRFFITLLCEQAKTDDPVKNYGITPLPNLENNFVAANSLLSIDIGGMREILQPRKVSNAKTKEGKADKLYENRKAELIDKITQLRSVRHQLFLPKTSDKKKALQQKDENLRKEIEGLTIALYDTRMKEQLAFLEKQLASAKHELESKSDEELSKSESTVQDAWFGIATTTKATKTLREKLQTQVVSSESRIAEIKSDSSKKQLLNDVARLIKWNPFSFNVAETFLDPEWMFGVKDGFDIVIGNPPYIQLQANGGELATMYANKGFETYDRTADIYCLFYEKGHKLLSGEGNLCFITSDKWMRNGCGDLLRKYLVEKTGCLLLVDFTDQQIFDAATVETNILLVARERTEKCVPMCCSLTEPPTLMLSQLVSEKEFACEFKSTEAWVLLSGVAKNIQDKVNSIGKPLGEWNVEMFRGILTGYNPGFIIDEDLRRRLISEDAKSAELIKPTLRGRDAQRYTFKQEKYIIVTHNGMKDVGVPRVDIDDYPAIKKYLDGFYACLAKRGDKGDTPYNLRDCAYMSAMSKPKIVWGEISDIPKFGYDQEGTVYCEATTFLMVGEHLPFIYLFLNSKFCEYYFAQIGTTTGMGTLRWKKYKIQELRLPTQYDAAKVDDLVCRMTAAKNNDADTSGIEDEVNEMVYKLYGLTDDEIAVVEKAVKK